MSRPVDRVSVDRLRELFYLSEAGVLMRRGNPDRSAGRIGARGYMRVGVDGTDIYSHRVVWAIYHGRHPSNLIDHINGIKTDNRIENLRECSYVENGFNSGAKRNSSSGIKGVHKDSSSKNWIVCVYKKRKQHMVSGFANPSMASDFAGLLREILHGEFSHD